MEKRNVSVGHFETTDEMRELVQQVLDSGRISYGPLCKQLEEEFAAIHQSPYAIVSASGTDALRAGLHALKIYHGWPDGAEVIVPATTFVATVNVVTQVGLTPVFVDVDEYHYCMDASMIASRVTPDTVAVFPVNLLGQPANLSAIDQVAWDNNLVMIEDSAEAMFVYHEGAPVGSWGQVAGFSFYMAHLITAGVGGITTTTEEGVAEIIRSLLNHGREPVYVSIDDDDGLTGDKLAEMVTKRFHFLYPGYSSRMTELQAALALPQLWHYEEMLASRRAIASQLTSGLGKHWRLQLPAEREEGQHSYMMYGIKMATGESKMPLVMHLEENGIETRDILPLVMQPVFTDWQKYEPGGKHDPARVFPVSAELVKTGFYIGCHQGMNDDDVQYICDVVDDFFRRN
jgi:dTDP-4-amino-4,6-dideoxygalactose transaminase